MLHNLSTKKILLVFDYADYGLALKTYLELNSFDVEAVHNNDAIAELFTRIKPDITITGHLRANEVISCIRGIDKEAKVIGMSPSFERLNIIAFKKLKANGYCDQSIEPKQLLPVIEKVLAGGEYWHNPYMLVKQN